MKFENPIMKISVFEVTDVVTASGEGEPATPSLSGEAKARAALESAGAVTTSILEFNY